MRIGSLFAGIGGLELGLEWAGVGETVWQVERDKYCTQVLAKHWPNATRYDDVCTVGAHNLEPVDVICGGFPCQDISYAGKGAGLSGARSGLWYEFARIVGEMGPRFVVVENVSALLTRGIGDVLGSLADLGYDAEWSTLRASDVGAPHRRERVFLIAWMADADARGPQVVAERHGHALRDPADRDSCRRDADGRGGYVGHPIGAASGRDARGVRGAEAPSDCARSADGRRADRLGDAGADVEHPDSGRREQRDAGERADAVAGAGHDAMGDAASGRRAGDDQHGHARPGDVRASGGRLGWHDATPVRGADGTVRLIPAEAAQAGPESAIWPVAHGVPGRVARLRAIGNAVVPQCAYVVGRRLLEIDATLAAERAA